VARVRASSEYEHYNSIAFAGDQIQILAHNSGGVAKGRKSFIVSEWPYLTRLFTTISPDEMTMDPMFHARSELTLGVSQSRQAVQLVQCSSDRTVTLPDGRVVALDATNWPAFSSAMPWAERIEEVPDEGDIVVLVDNSDEIDALLADWNELIGVDIEPGEGLSTGGTGTGNSSNSSSSSSQGTGGEGGAKGERNGKSGGGGCSCQLPGSPQGGSLLLLSLLGAAGVASRRIRRRHR
jgi:MYXO-CTERM domain-containing protein